MSAHLFFQQIVNGLITGSAYALIAVGVTFIFGLTGIVNFAQGQFLIVAAYIASEIGMGSVLRAAVVLVVASLAMGAAGAIAELTLFQWTLKKPINGFIISLGLVVISEGALTLAYGANSITVTSPIRGVFQWHGLTVTRTGVIGFIIAMLVVAGFWLYLRSSQTGAALRACSADSETATLMGIRAPRMFTTAFAVGCAMAGVAGVLYAANFPFNPFIGNDIVVKGFVIALAGGLGSIMGALCIALLVGVGEALLVGAGHGGWTQAVLFTLVVVVLMVRPQGLFRGVEGSAVV